MAKNIVICSDGTGNSANKNRGTNVFKLYEAVDIERPEGDAPRQLAFYDDGVGTSAFKPLSLLGGAFGWGLGRNIRQLYTALVRAYQPGDRLYFFGFSRGAFTVRSLVGMISRMGILDISQMDDDKQLEEEVRRTYARYRQAFRFYRPRSEAGTVGTPCRKEGKRYLDVPIEFVGVWDTVDAVGLPFDELTTLLNWFIRFKFPDYTLSPHVRCARHALSLDDERKTFHPLLWDESPEKGERIRQVWFAGVHSNVGGGYVKQGLSLITLDWMMTEAERQGLRFVPADRRFVRDHANPHDKLYDSRAGLAMYYRYLPRDIADLCEVNQVRPRIHCSAMERAALGTEGYAPANWPDNTLIEFDGQETNAETRPLREMTGDSWRGSSLWTGQQPGIRLRRYLSYPLFLLSSFWLLLATVTPEAKTAGEVLARRLLPDAQALCADPGQSLAAFLRELGTLLSRLASADLPERLLQVAGTYPFLPMGIATAIAIGILAHRWQRRRASTAWHLPSAQLRAALEL